MCAILQKKFEFCSVLAERHHWGWREGLKPDQGGEWVPSPMPGDSPTSFPSKVSAKEEHMGSINPCQAGTRWYLGRTS